MAEYNPVPGVASGGGVGSPHGLNVNPNMFGGGLAEATGEIGQRVERIADQQFEIQQKFLQMQVETDAMDASSAFSKAAGDLEIEFSQKKGTAARDALPEYQEKLQKAQEEYGQNLKSPMAQQIYRQRTEGYKNSSSHSFGLHTADQVERAHSDALDNSIDAAEGRAVRQAVQQGTAPNVDEIISSTLIKAHDNGASPETAAAMVQNATASAYQNTIAGLIAAGRPMEAQAVYQSALNANAPGTDIPLLNPEQIGAVGGAVKTSVQNFGKDFLQTLDPAARVDLLSKAVKEKTGTPIDFLDPGDKFQALRQAQEALRIDRERALAEVNERIASDLAIKVGLGTATVPEVEAAFAKNQISGAQRASWIVQINKEGDYQGLTLSFLNGSNVADPKSEKDRNASSTYFDKVITPQIQGMKPDEAKTVISQYVEKIGIIPDRLKGQIRGALRAGSPAMRVQAADLIDRFSTSMPHALDDFSVEDIAEGKALAQMIRDGIPQDKALLLADEMQKIPKDVIELRTKKLTERRAGGVAGPLLDRSTDKLIEAVGGRSYWQYFTWQETPLVMDAAKADFRRIFEQAYLMTGDENVAMDTAKATIQKTWAVSTVNGHPELMKNAPEAHYKIPSQDNGWIRQQFLKDAASLGWVDPAKGDITERMAAVPDDMTARNLTYRVMLKNEYGQFEAVRDASGQPIRWKPDFAVSDRAAEIAREDKERRAKAIEYAREKKKALEGMYGGRDPYALRMQ